MWKHWSQTDRQKQAPHTAGQRKQAPKGTEPGGGSSGNPRLLLLDLLSAMAGSFPESTLGSLAQGWRLQLWANLHGANGWSRMQMRRVRVGLPPRACAGHPLTLPLQVRRAGQGSRNDLPPLTPWRAEEGEPQVGAGCCTGLVSSFVGHSVLVCWVKPSQHLKVRLHTKKKQKARRHCPAAQASQPALLPGGPGQGTGCETCCG